MQPLLTTVKHGALIRVGPYSMAAYPMQDAEGNYYLQVGGIDCNLEGEQPGMYYPTPLED